MRVRYQADADCDRRIVRATRRVEPTMDFQAASEARAGAGLHSLSDLQVLTLTAQEGRIVVTHDHRTMPGHFATFITTQASPGVIIIPQHLLRRVAVEWLLTIWGASEAEEGVNHLIFFAR